MSNVLSKECINNIAVLCDIALKATGLQHKNIVDSVLAVLAEQQASHAADEQKPA